MNEFDKISSRHKLETLYRIGDRIIDGVRQSDRLRENLDRIRAEKYYLMEEQRSLLENMSACAQDRHVLDKMLLRKYYVKIRSYELWLSEATQEILNAEEEVSDATRLALSTCIDQMTVELEKTRQCLKALQSPCLTKLNASPHWIFLVQKLLQTLFLHPDSRPFQQPVDVVSLNIPEYYEIIQFPMDLSTIRCKLDQQRYICLNEIDMDIKQMFENCRIFNPKKDPITVMCDRLELEWELQIRDMAYNLSSEGRPPS
jgi:hypothetical protein